MLARPRGKKYLYSLIIIAANLIFQVMPVFAQAVIGSISITKVDYSSFPLMTVRVQILDDLSLPISGITVDDLSLSENNETASFTLTSVEIGSKVVFVIDAGAGVNADGATFSSRIKEMKVAASKYFDSMAEEDSAEIILVTPGRVEVLQPFTSDKQILKDAMSSLEVTTGSSLTRGLEGVEKALRDLQIVTGDTGTIEVVLFSSGIQRSGGIYISIDDIVERAEENNIPVHTLLFRDALAPYSLDVLADRTGGQFLYYRGPDTPTSLYSLIDLKGLQYELSYITTLTASERTIIVSANTSATNAPQASQTIKIEPSPQAPQVHSVLVNNGDPLIREFPEGDTDVQNLSLTEVRISAEVDWVDGYGRGVKWAELLVDGNPTGGRITRPGELLTFVWDLRSYIQPGETTIPIQIRVQDDIGFESTTDPLLITVQVEIPEIVNLGEVYGGTSLVLVLVVIVVGSVFFIRYRGVILQKAGEVGGGVIDFIDEKTAPLRGRSRRLKPVGYLIGTSGAEMRRRFKVHRGVTPVGRSPQFASPSKGGILLTSEGVSGLHFTIMEADGEFTITDNGSENGTWVNGDELSSEESHPLSFGDIIELVEFDEDEREVKFIFESTTSTSESDDGDITGKTRN